MVDMILNI